MRKMTKAESGKLGSDVRWTNYRKHLIDELSALCTKQELSFYMEFSNSALQEALLIKRGQKNKFKTSQHGK